jgi:Na+-transporting NADH:ubiquinone oxidoreductase subunit NqrE
MPNSLSNLLLYPDGGAILALSALHCAIGLAAALVAQRRGLPFRKWLVIGLIGGTAALIAACFWQPRRSP